MNTNRMEAFSDGVIAIIITIMVLELKVPHGADVAALAPMIPKFLAYVLSFIYVGIYWNNHHHLLYATKQVSGGILWAGDHHRPRAAVVTATGRWPRSEGQDFAGALCAGHRGRGLVALDFTGVAPGRCAHVADTRSAH
jgi:hypothetical protein